MNEFEKRPSEFQSITDIRLYDNIRGPVDYDAIPPCSACSETITDEGVQRLEERGFSLVLDGKLIRNAMTPLREIWISKTEKGSKLVYVADYGECSYPPKRESIVTLPPEGAKPTDAYCNKCEWRSPTLEAFATVGGLTLTRKILVSEDKVYDTMPERR